MSKKSKKFANKLVAQTQLTAQNALDEALRISDCDVWSNTSLSTLNAYSNVKMDILTFHSVLLTYLYKTYGILAKIVDIPVDDAYKYGGFEVKAETLDDNETKELLNALRRNNDIEVLKTARKWTRLFGGGALIVLDGNKLSIPLDYKKLYKRPFELMAVDRWQLRYSKPNIDVEGGSWSVVNYQKLDNTDLSNIHPSRIHILHGKRAPYIIAQQVQGWGISVYEQIFQDMAQFFKARNVLFELMDEAKTDILKLHAMETALGSAQGERALQRMVDLISRNKNYKSQITLATEDDYDQKQISFSGFEGILKEIRVMMSGSANMPVNKLWGEGVTGFGSGEDSLENYNSQIEAEIRTPDEETIYWILKLRSYQLFGREIEDLLIDWKELRVMSSTDEQQLNTSKIDNVLKLFDRQLLSPQEVMEILRKDGIILHDTKAIRGELEDMDFNEEEETSDNDNKDKGHKE